MFKFLLLLLLGATSLSACKATVISGEQHGPRKAMLSYQDSIPLPVLWESWTPITKNTGSKTVFKLCPFRLLTG